MSLMTHQELDKTAKDHVLKLATMITLEQIYIVNTMTEIDELEKNPQDDDDWKRINVLKSKISKAQANCEFYEILFKRAKELFK